MRQADENGKQAGQLHPEWTGLLSQEFEQDYMKNLRKFLNAEKKAGKIIYPRGKDIFNSFNSTPVSQVRVIIIGQDPYHGEGQAHGLSFSVKEGVPVPPSLRNIYKELREDLSIEPPDHGCLQSWASQGVLLLNAVLTVEKGLAGSHQKRGWETFTDQAIAALSQSKENLVFILWGAYAQKKGAQIDRKRHLVISSPHPSPLSASRGFFGSRPFSQANRYLISHGLSPVRWHDFNYQRSR